MPTEKTPSIDIRPGAAPFLLDGGEAGVVCVHGFTASPEEMRWLGDYLNARGLTVYAPRLAGHGTDPDLMRRQVWQTWYEDVLDGVALLRARCRSVYAAGLSMGGLLTLRAASAGALDGAVVMAAPLYTFARGLRFARWLKYVRPFIPDAFQPNDLDARVRAIQREMGRPDYGRVAYAGKPTASVAQLYSLMRDVERRLGAVTVPLLLIYSRGDRTVPYGNMARVARRVRSADLVQRTLEHSDHCLTQETERETVYAMVWDFLAARMAP